MKKGIIVLVALLAINCKDKTTDVIKSENSKSESSTADKKPVEIKYVNTESGLNYRDKPKGKKLGKLNFNKKILIVSHTGIFEKIEQDSIEGEWVGTLVKNKKVFVFNGFLSDSISKSQAEINAEIDAVTETKIKEIISKELNKTHQEQADEFKIIKEEYYNSFREGSGKYTSTGETYGDSINQKWLTEVNESIKPVKDTVVITDEIILIKNLRSNRVFLIDTPILNFHKTNVSLHKYYYQVNNHFTSTNTGTLFLENLKNVEFIGRKQRVYFICYRYGESILQMSNVQKFVFKNFSFYYPTSEYDRKNQEENLDKEGQYFYGISIYGGYGKFINCNINGVGSIGIKVRNISNENGITFEDSTFSNIQQNIINVEDSHNISFNNVTIKDNNSKSIIQLKDDEDIGSSSTESISFINCKISNNKAKKFLGFGKSFDNKVLSSNAVFKNCEISNNNFQKTFLNFNYKKDSTAEFYNCEINDNKIFDVYECSSPSFLSGERENSAKFRNTTFKNNDWNISAKERETYFK